MKYVLPSMFKYILSYIFVSSLQSVLAETDTIKTWHTSQRSLVQLYDLQAEHFVAVNDYLRSESKRLEELKNILAKAYEWRDYRIVNRTISYLHNHINAAQTIKRIQHLFRVVEKLTNNKQFVEVLSKIDNYKNISEQNIRLSSQGLRRLQIFYKIPVSDMVVGTYRNRIIGDQMNACECYVMSTYCFEENSVFGAADWAIHAYKKWISGDQSKCVDIKRLTFILISTSTATGFNFEHLLNSRTSYYSERTENLARHFHQMSDEIFFLNGSRTYFDLFDVYNTIVLSQYDLKFRELCYQHGESSRTLTKDCVCQYQTKNSLYRILMPFKEEIIHCNPHIKIYHDVLYDDEIEKIKSICSDSLEDATVISKSGGKLLLEKTRSGKVCRIFEEEAAGVLDSLNARIECFTGLSTLLAEPYQIVNYGLGGHYVQHHDALDRIHVKEFGSRYLTVLFYLSNVQFDGSTVFPVLDIVSPARKGTALVWYNVHTNNGSIDLDSLHGSCPILEGNKWIMTRWLHEVGQNLSYDWRIATD